MHRITSEYYLQFAWEADLDMMNSGWDIKFQSIILPIILYYKPL